jgi:hypothetical protein
MGNNAYEYTTWLDFQMVVYNVRKISDYVEGRPEWMLTRSVQGTGRAVLLGDSYKSPDAAMTVAQADLREGF